MLKADDVGSAEMEELARFFWCVERQTVRCHSLVRETTGSPLLQSNRDVSRAHAVTTTDTYASETNGRKESRLAHQS